MMFEAFVLLYIGVTTGKAADMMAITYKPFTTDKVVCFIPLMREDKVRYDKQGIHLIINRWEDPDIEYTIPPKHGAKFLQCTKGEVITHRLQ